MELYPWRFHTEVTKLQFGILTLCLGHVTHTGDGPGFPSTTLPMATVLHNMHTGTQEDNSHNVFRRHTEASQVENIYFGDSLKIIT